MHTAVQKMHAAAWGRAKSSGSEVSLGREPTTTWAVPAQSTQLGPMLSVLPVRTGRKSGRPAWPATLIRHVVALDPACKRGVRPSAAEAGNPLEIELNANFGSDILCTGFRMVWAV